MVAVQAAMANEDTSPRSISKFNIQEASITEENNAYSDERKKNSARSQTTMMAQNIKDKNNQTSERNN